MRQRSILYLDHSAKQVGGGQFSLLLLLNHLDRSRYRPILVCGRRGWLSQKAEELCVQVHVLPIHPRLLDMYREELRVNPWAGFEYAYQVGPSVIDLRRMIHRLGITLVHTNETLSHILGGLASRAAGVNHISHIRSIYKPGIQGDAIRRAIVTLSDRVIVVSKAVKEMFKPFRRANARVRTIYNAVDTSAFKGSENRDLIRKQLGIKNGEVAVGIVGRLVAWKGHELFLNAASKVAEQIPWARFVVVGEGPLMGHLVRFAESLRIDGRTNFVGFREDVLEVISSLDILVLSSVEPDPFPRVVIEAMTVGMPVVAVKTGGVEEALGNREGGVVVPHQDPLLLADEIVHLIHNPEVARLLGDLGKDRARRLYNPELHARNVEAVYEELL
jgi:glycosyltransferase involved in cell wall biosynthesis